MLLWPFGDLSGVWLCYVGPLVTLLCMPCFAMLCMLFGDLSRVWLLCRPFGDLSVLGYAM